MTRFLKINSLLIASIAIALAASSANAQDGANDDPAAQGDAIIVQADAPETEDLANSDDPADQVAAYFIAMGDIVNQNIEAPDALLAAFDSYIKENEVNMRKASKAFEVKLRKLKASDAELYRETTQRKITPALEKLITNLIQFADRHPEAAKKLDSMLKVDAKYTYQP